VIALLVTAMERRLAAILCADVYGYSRLMGEDEEATLRTLTSHRKLIDSSIEQHRGRFVNSAGDSVLAEFASVVGAVNCAVEIQTALKSANADLPPPRRMEFRIGVNLGDVMVEGEQIYGDGVNVAARLESLADPGGICLSGTVHEQVRDKLAIAFEDRGEQAVKNIARPVRVWRVGLDAAAPPRPTTRQIARSYRRGGALSIAGIGIIAMIVLLVQHLSLRTQPTHASIPAPHPHPYPLPQNSGRGAEALSLPRVPSIAVLPFANLSGDPQQEYFSDGITDDLITDLSRLPNLFVIARTSTFIYKGKAEKVQTVGRELGVKYLLEGSARKAGDQVRVNVRLVDATNGNQVWANRYDREMRDIFQLQDQIVRSLTATLGLQFPILEKGSVITQRTDNLEAYDYLLRGYQAFFAPTPDALASAAKMFQRAMALDRRYADAYAALAFVNWLEYAWQWDSDPHPLDRAEELARKAVLLDDSNASAYAVRGWVAALKNRVDEAITDGQRAVALNPNNAFNYQALSDIYNWVGKPGAALTAAYKGMRLDPNHPESYALQIGSADNALWRYSDALKVLKAGLAASEGLSNNPWVHVALIETYSELGRGQDARLEATEVMRVAPKFSLEAVKRRYATCDCQTDQHFYDNLRKAGLS